MSDQRVTMNQRRTLDREEKKKKEKSEIDTLLIDGGANVGASGAKEANPLANPRLDLQHIPAACAELHRRRRRQRQWRRLALAPILLPLKLKPGRAGLFLLKPLIRAVH